MSKKYLLKDLLEIKNGKDYKHLSVGEIPVYGSGGIMTFVDEFIYEGESILLPRKGTLDNIIYIDGKFWTVDTMYWSIVNTDLVYPKYLYCYLSLLDLSCKNSGSTLPSMTFDSYYSLTIELPDLTKQKQIGDFVFKLITKIETNNKINDELESMAKTIYDYWFLQFEFPNEEGKPYKSSGGKMVWNEELKREIPEGWEVDILKNCVSNEKNAIVDGPFGTQLKIGEYVDSGIPIYEMEQLNGNFIVAKPKHFITEEKYLDVKRSTVKNGDIIISKTGTLGLLGIVKSDKEKGIIVSRLAKITPDENKIGKYTLLIFLSKLTDSGYWLKQSNGSTMPILNNGLIENTKIILPNNDLYLEFETIITPFYEKIYNIQKENQELISIRDFLLPLLMNGQIGFKKVALAEG